MKLTLIPILILLTILISSCKGRELVYSNGKIKEIFFREETTTNDYPVLGKVTYFASGSVKSLELSRDYAISVGLLKKGSTIFFGISGTITTFPVK